MVEQPERLVEGLKIILSLFDHAKGVIGIESNKPLAIEKLTELTKDEPKITVCPLKAKYPQGGERNLVYAITGRRLNSKLLPADLGCVVDNVDTVISIQKAVSETTPLIRRIFTVTGDAVKEPKNLEVKIGTSFEEILEEAGGLNPDAEKMIAGGPMMGFALTTCQVPVVKTSSALLCLKEDDVSRNRTTGCIRCGKCVEACPSHLVPERMMAAAERHDLEYFVALNGMECYECGSCAYICPARRPLTQGFKMMRAAVMAERRKAQQKK